MIRMPRNRWIAVLVTIAVVAGVSAWFFTPASAKTDDSVLARVKKGEFKVVVTSAGASGPLRCHFRPERPSKLS